MTLWQDADARRFVYARREVYYNYPTSGDGAMLSRLDNLADDSSGTTKYAQYTYMGGGSIVKVDHPAVTNGLTLSYGSGGTYAAFERFGRIIDQKWTANGSASDEFTYGYDHAEGGKAVITNSDLPQRVTLHPMNAGGEFVLAVAAHRCHNIGSSRVA